MRGDLLDFDADPGLGDPSPHAVRFRADHWLLIEDGRIAGAQRERPRPGWQRHDHRGRLSCRASSTPTCTARSST